MGPLQDVASCRCWRLRLRHGLRHLQLLRAKAALVSSAPLRRHPACALRPCNGRIRQQMRSSHPRPRRHLTRPALAPRPAGHPWQHPAPPADRPMRAVPWVASSLCGPRATPAGRWDSRTAPSEWTVAVLCSQPHAPHRSCHARPTTCDPHRPRLRQCLCPVAICPLPSPPPRLRLPPHPPRAPRPDSSRSKGRSSAGRAPRTAAGPASSHHTPAHSKILAAFPLWPRGSSARCWACGWD
mmetsp:Transcript_26313/g.84690  ORF Transcript_26313/g.84690 Transcript_26313/m.84690 type:complete len:240 (+) Transcript_26313:231-950(+)